MTEDKKTVPLKHYTNERTLWTVSWDNLTKTFTIVFELDYWDWLNNLPEEEKKLWRHIHFIDLSNKIEEIIDTGNYNP